MTPEEVGSAIAWCRKTTGMTIKELAERAGLTRANLSNIEAGKRDMLVGTLLRIATALGVPPSSLIDGHGPSVVPDPPRWDHPGKDAAGKHVEKARNLTETADDIYENYMFGDPGTGLDDDARSMIATLTSLAQAHALVAAELRTAERRE